MLRERINPSDFESERFAANLVERLGWAVVDASEAEEDPVGEAELVEDQDEEPEPVAPSEREPITV